MDDENRYGQATVHPDAAVMAGGFGTWTITYTAGREGIKLDGGIELDSALWKWFLPQSTDPVSPGYITVSGSNPDSIISVVSEDYNTTIALKVKEKALCPGDKISLTYGDTSGGGNLNARGQVHMGVGDEIEFRIAIDSSGTGKYVNIAKTPRLCVIAGPAVSFSVVVSSNQKAGTSSEIVVAALDKDRNIAVDYEKTVTFTSSDAKAVLPENYTFTSKDRARHRFPLILNTPGIQRIEVTDSDSISQKSNPVNNQTEVPRHKLYWGDMHGHSGLSDGRGTVDDYYIYARDIAKLDFTALTDHDESISNSQWEMLREKTALYNEAGDFVAFSAYEWTSWAYGHRCVYYLSDDQPIYRNKSCESDTPQKLWEMLEGRDVIVIPHHPTGLGDRMRGDSAIVDWDLHNSTLQPLVEMFSSHGNFEFHGCAKNKITGLNRGSFVQDALIRGHRLGIIASSDSHDGHPGLSGPFFYSYIPFRGESKACLVAVYAEELTREAIWNALKNRRCYGTTGIRMILDFKLNGHMMGEEVAIKTEAGEQDTRRIKVFAAGTQKIEKIDIVRNNVDIYTHRGTTETEGFEYIDEDLIENGSYYYIRVTQKDGEMAWSSPVWCTV